jgi:hypothetical protein
MGGSGSAWQGAKKATVDDSLSLSMVALKRERTLLPGTWTPGSWQWSCEDSETERWRRSSSSLLERRSLEPSAQGPVSGQLAVAVFRRCGRADGLDCAVSCVATR